jgi:hypothetical protein
MEPPKHLQGNPVCAQQPATYMKTLKDHKEGGWVVFFQTFTHSFIRRPSSAHPSMMVVVIAS